MRKEIFLIMQLTAYKLFGVDWELLLFFLSVPSCFFQYGSDGVVTLISLLESHSFRLGRRDMRVLVLVFLLAFG